MYIIVDFGCEHTEVRFWFLYATKGEHYTAIKQRTTGGNSTLQTVLLSSQIC